jgi:hypothetical protein
MNAKNQPAETTKELKKEYTQGKTPEFAIYNNLALLRILRLIYYWIDKSNIPSLSQIDKTFRKEYLRPFTEAKFGEVPHDLPEIVYSKLREYLWKGYQENKNSSGHWLTKEDKKIIRMLIAKLYALRNYHSHVWHPNNELNFNSWVHEVSNDTGVSDTLEDENRVITSVTQWNDDTLLKFVKKKHDDLVMALKPEFGKDINKYEAKYRDNPLFDKENYITPLGKTFFLSFFLTSSEMTRLLQQQEENKRNTELKHRVNKYILKYYTHRDGATRHIFNQEESLLDTLPKEEQEEIFKIRNAYQIINYLNDIPDTANDIELFPLLIKNSNGNWEPVRDAKAMLPYISNIPFFSEKFNISVAKIKVKDDDDLTDDKKDTKKKLKEEDSRKMLMLKYKDTAKSQIPFYLSSDTIHKMVLDLQRDGSAEKRITDRFKSFYDDRKKLIDLLKANPDIRIKKLPVYNEQLIAAIPGLADYATFKLKGNEKLQRCFENWYYDIRFTRDGVKKGGEKFPKYYEPESRTRLLTELTNREKELEIVSPIQLRYYDFYYEAEQKPRSEDLFCVYAVRYLCDYKLTPGWQWQFETFQNEDKNDRVTGELKSVNRRKPHYSDVWLHKMRLSLSNGNVMFMYKGFTFTLGHKALKNLIIAHFDKKVKNLSTFADTHVAYLEKLGTNLTGNSSYTLQQVMAESEGLIEPFELPRYQLLALNDAEAWQEEADYTKPIIARINYIISKLTALRTDPQGVFRNEKNAQVMKCYQYFAWNYAGSDKFKFLRRNEHNLMSIYHYLLGKRSAMKKLLADTQKDLKTASHHDRRKLQNTERSLIQGLKKMEEIPLQIPYINDRMPKHLWNLLQNAKDLDDLFVQVTTLAETELRKWQAELKTASVARIAEIRQKLDLPVLVTPENADALKSSKWAFMFSNKSLSIHPLSVVKYFYKEEYAKAKAESDAKNVLLRQQGAKLMAAPDFGISKRIRDNKLFTGPLHIEHYNFQPYVDVLKTIESEKLEKGSHRTEKIKGTISRIIGKNKEQLTEDGLLLKIALAYLSDSQADIAASFKEKVNMQNFKVGNLRKLDIQMPILLEGNKKAVLELKFHQLDDYLIMESKEQLQKAARHLLLRLQQDNKPLPPADEEKKYHFPYIDVLTEINTVYQNALAVADGILYWERGIIANANKESVLPENKYISFEEVCIWAGLTEDETKVIRSALRNHAFHSTIPVDWTYKSKLKEVDSSRHRGIYKKIDRIK